MAMENTTSLMVPRADDSGDRDKPYAKFSSLINGTLHPSPRGMDFLIGVDTLYVRQLIELAEVYSGFDACNKYEVLNCSGHRLCLAGEKSDGFVRWCFRSRRPFTGLVMNLQGRIVLKLERPCTCCCCFSTGLFCNELRVSTDEDTYLGKISQNFKCTKFTVFDSTNRKVLKIKGPCCGCVHFNCKVKFEVLDITDKKIGDITKHWDGVSEEVLSSAETYSLNFPVDLDLLLKTLILGAVILLDFVYFEN